MGAGALGGLFGGAARGLQAYAALKRANEERQYRQQRDKIEDEQRKEAARMAQEQMDMLREQRQLERVQAGVVKVGPGGAPPKGGIQVDEDEWIDPTREPQARALDVLRKQEAIRSEQNVREREALRNKGLLWNPESGGYSSSAPRRQIGTVNQQIDDTRAQLQAAAREKPKPRHAYLSPADSVSHTTDTKAASARIRELAAKLDSLTAVRDSMAAAEQGRPAGRAAAPSPVNPLTVDPLAERRAAWDRAAAVLRKRGQSPETTIGARP